MYHIWWVAHRPKKSPRLLIRPLFGADFYRRPCSVNVESGLGRAGDVASCWLPGGPSSQLIPGLSLVRSSQPGLWLAAGRCQTGQLISRPVLSSVAHSQVSPVSIWAGKWPALPCPAPCARPGTRRGTLGCSRPQILFANTVLVSQEERNWREPWLIVAYFLLHSELRLRSRESGTECSIETGMDSPQSGPVITLTRKSQRSQKLSQPLVKILIWKFLDQFLNVLASCHVNLLETHHAPLTQFSVYFKRFIFLGQSLLSAIITGLLGWESKLWVLS